MRRRKAFTLVELLVVIAIIAILISILLPVCIKIRRRALVLASPIAYVGADRCLYLTGPKGGYELKVNPPDLLVPFSYASNYGNAQYRPGFIVVTKDLKVLRYIPTTVKPASNAAYRKYGHR